MEAFEIDSDGFVVDNFIYKPFDGNDEKISIYTINKNGEIEWIERSKSDFVFESWSESFHKPKWDSEKWIEGMSDEEIEALHNQPREPSKLEILKEENEMNAMAIMELAELIMGGGM